MLINVQHDTNDRTAYKWLKNANEDLYGSHQLNISDPLAQAASNVMEAIRATGQ